MARVELREVTKAYPGVHALDRLSFEVGSGEFFTLLGPSGCGKTTLLRTVAGFVRQDAGQVLFDGSSVDALPAYRRDTGMVFQDYAIFPHLSVGENVAFGLRNRKVPKAEIAERVAEALETVRMSGYAGRMPHELSGGQQQRVGLARAMVIKPSVLLMDEPLSNLDAKLRVELREDIGDLQRALGITTLYVTHDQEEALVVSDRICVMRAGRIEQIGSPSDVYRRPATRFVGAFVGAMNFFEPWPEQWPSARTVAEGHGADTVVAVRPEDVEVGARPGRDAARFIEFEAKVAKILFTGREAQYTLHAAAGPVLTAHVTRPEESPVAELGHDTIAAIPVGSLQFFDAATGQRS